MHITNTKLYFDIFTVGTFKKYFSDIQIFGRKEKLINVTHTNVLLAIATNIPVRLETGFVVQGPKWLYSKLQTLWVGTSFE